MGSESQNTRCTGAWSTCSTVKHNSAVQYSAVQRRVHLVDAGGGVDPVLQVQQDLGPGLEQAQRQAGHQHRHLGDVEGELCLGWHDGLHCPRYYKCCGRGPVATADKRVNKIISTTSIILKLPLY